MKKPQKILWVLGAVFVIIAAYTLSLFDVSMGNPATIYNATTTACYVAFWALYLVFNRSGWKRLTFSCVLSGVTFVCSCAITYINFAKIVLRPGNFVLMLTFFSTPFYGVHFLVHNMAWFMVVVTIISCVWFGFSLFLRKRKK